MLTETLMREENTGLFVEWDETVGEGGDPKARIYSVGLTGRSMWASVLDSTGKEVFSLSGKQNEEVNVTLAVRVVRVITGRSIQWLEKRRQEEGLTDRQIALRAPKLVLDGGNGHLSLGLSITVQVM